ncbi:DUF2585 family protein [Fulvimarina sp. 2208YS6-2-32]|uniref:DUF2585 family protein n=1 Tax=Fulvimarina uroteuthidis TaxID=3098149 RepID=A0ABU5HZI0_9HYPH|nr:DUF2585 family protein [Fulvimarina sp. 2208YS6-2-32]MDY8107994.1 DUF2585 family protein [Fulvimarina sp. 2208YS6-2-32]
MIDHSKPEIVSARYRVPAAIACILLLNAALASYLALTGRPLLTPDHPFQLWSTALGAGDNSLHLTDPYSLSHALFGIGLFFLVDGLKPGWPLAPKLVVAVAGSTVWELVENTPFVIDLFNDASKEGAYQGDSIANALGDTAFVMLGFLFAARVPVVVALAAGLGLEIAVGVLIDDGLLIGTLKLLGLYP